MRLFCYAKANQMEEPHRFTDDVAIVSAKTKDEAVRVCKMYYSNCTAEDVFEVKFTKNGIAILTDY